MDNYDLDIDPEKMCRICLSQTSTTDKLHNIFTNSIVDGYIISLPEMIRVCVELLIVEVEGLPNKICQNCKEQVVNFYAFKQKCKRTENVLQATFLGKSNARATPAEVPVPDILENDTNLINNEEYIFQSLREKHDEAILIDGTDIENISRRFACKFCDTFCDSEEHLQNHIEVCSKHNPDQMKYFELGVKNDDKDETNADTSSESTSDLQHENIEPECEVEEEIEALSEFKDIAMTNTVNDISVESFLCVPCDVIFLDKNVYHNHCKSHDVEYGIEEYEDKIEPLQPTPIKIEIVCEICNQKMKTKAQAERHTKIHEALNLITEYLEFQSCHICRLLFLHKNELVEHNKCHKSPSDEDEIDDGTCTDYQFLEDDKLNEGNADEYKCGICFVSFQTVTTLKQHIISHSKRFECPFRGCGYDYDSSLRLSCHMIKKHIDNNINKCPYCLDDRFESLIALQTHTRSNCLAKKFSCTHCDKKFLSARSLSHHMKFLEKRHNCKECGKAFAQQGELKLHQRIHTGERPFKCNVCNKTYKTASMRSAHMDTHIEGKTFQCNICGKKFQTRTCYRNHIKRHTEEKKHECDVCGKKFYSKYHAKIHKEKVHKMPKVIKTTEALDDKASKYEIEFIEGDYV